MARKKKQEGAEVTTTKMKYKGEPSFRYFARETRPEDVMARSTALTPDRENPMDIEARPWAVAVSPNPASKKGIALSFATTRKEAEKRAELLNQEETQRQTMLSK